MDAMSVARGELVSYVDGILQSARFNDYCPNGLQVEGAPRIARVVSGVTASEALIRAAIDLGADTLLVHHGWFWRGEDARVTGIRRQRMKLLLAHDINLLAWHLPLDAHPELGNNAALARVLGWQCTERFGRDALGMVGTPGEGAPPTAAELAAHVQAALGRAPLLVGDPDRPVRQVAWCTGGAQGWLQDAVDAGADLYLSGEISEPTTHLARESGVAYLAAGHHATERYGVQALGAHLAERFGVWHRFVDIDNPA